MEITVTIDDAVLDELMQIVETDDRSEAVGLAIREFIRRDRLCRFKRLRGTLRDMPGNEEIEAADLERAQRLAEGGE